MATNEEYIIQIHDEISRAARNIKKIGEKTKLLTDRNERNGEIKLKLEAELADQKADLENNSAVNIKLLKLYRTLQVNLKLQESGDYAVRMINPSNEVSVYNYSPEQRKNSDVINELWEKMQPDFPFPN